MRKAAERARAGSATDAGRVRDNNEDRLYVDVERGIFLVVDGVGGHAAGEVAATIARDVIVERLQRPTQPAAQRVREAIALANNEIFRQASGPGGHAGMTCVLTAAVLEEGRLTIGHVGDTRLYALSAGGIVKLTHDHSPIGEREDAREISEADAMHHPRRNEVFRDVGSAYHEPDDADFIEVVEVPFEPNGALVLCSDGLSDMLTATAIERTVIQHTGHPTAVAQALVAAANDAGGTDNISVVYVEGARFHARPANLLARLAASRTVWLTAGIVAGPALGLAASLWLMADATGPRRLTVGGPAHAAYPTIAAAIADARTGDIVSVEPGNYPEEIVLPDGVDLVARLPDTVTLVAPPGQHAWVSITARGHLGHRISGIRIAGTPGAPIDTGLVLAGHELAVDDVTIEGVVRVGMDVLDDGAIAIRSTRFTAIDGLPMRVGPTARPTVRLNRFTRAPAGPHGPPLAIAPDSNPLVTDNVFVGYAPTDVGAFAHGNHIVGGPSRVR